MNSKNILVLGGEGFIGASLVKLLLRQGHKVSVLSQSPPRGSLIPVSRNRFTLKYDEKSFSEFFKDNHFDDIHFLSGNPSPQNSSNDAFMDIEKTNIVFVSLLEALVKNSFQGHLWFASSVAVYGANTEDPLSEDSVCLHLSHYAVGKLMAEEHLKLYNRTRGLKVGAYRIFSTYGPELHRQVVYDLLMKLQDNPNEVRVLGSGDEARDLSYVDDLAAAISLLSEKTVPQGNIFNVGSGQIYTVKQILFEMTKILKIQPNVIYTQETRMYDGKYWRANISKIEQLGFKSSYDLKKGLERTIKSIYEEK